MEFKMKKRFFIGVLVAIMILFMAQNVFAVTSNDTQNVTANVSNSTTLTLEERLQKEAEEKAKAANETAKNANSSENKVTSNVTNTAENKVNSNVTNTTENTSVKVEKNNVYSDIYVGEAEDDLLYENAYIDGNVYIMSAKKVIFKNCEVAGNIFLMSNELELEKTKVEGSAYILANRVDVKETQIKSAYITSVTLNVDESSEFVNDIRAVANVINNSGKVGRDSFVQVHETSDSEYTISINDILPEILAEFVITLILALIILNTSPKFVEVNTKLKISSFFKAFFTGILEIIIITAIALGIMALGYGVGFAFAILGLMFVLLSFGKVIFIVAFALRMVKNSDKNVITKAFIFTIIVGAVAIALELLSLLGSAGAIASLVIDVILAITGFGTLLRVVLTKTKKSGESKPQNSAPKASYTVESSNIPEAKAEPVVAPKIAEPADEEVSENDETKKNSKSEDSSKTETFEIKGQFVKKDLSDEKDKKDKDDE